jgi:hypothetical protein
VTLDSSEVTSEVATSSLLLWEYDEIVTSLKLGNKIYEMLLFLYSSSPREPLFPENPVKILILQSYLARAGFAQVGGGIIAPKIAIIGNKTANNGLRYFISFKKNFIFVYGLPNGRGRSGEAKRSPSVATLLVVSILETLPPRCNSRNLYP